MSRTIEEQNELLVVNYIRKAMLEFIMLHGTDTSENIAKKYAKIIIKETK